MAGIVVLCCFAGFIVYLIAPLINAVGTDKKPGALGILTVVLCLLGAGLMLWAWFGFGGPGGDYDKMGAGIFGMIFLLASLCAFVWLMVVVFRER